MAQLGTVILRGLLADRPTDNATATAGRLYFTTDTGEIYRDNGVDWDAVPAAANVGSQITVDEVDGTPSVVPALHLTFPNGTLAAAGSHATYTPATATTSAAGEVVLATPSSDTTAGHVVQANDARLSDARTPTAHTHPHTDVTDWDEAVQDTVGAAIVAGTNMTVTYDDTAGTVTLDAAGGGGTIGGTIASTQIAVGSGADTIGGSVDFVRDAQGHVYNTITGFGGAAIGGFGDTGYGGDFEAYGAGGWGAYGYATGAGSKGLVGEVGATDGVPLTGLAPSGQTANLLELQVDGTTVFAVDPTGDIAVGGGGGGGAGTVVVEELDGVPSVAADTIKFPNGTLTDNGDGSVTYSPASSGGGSSPLTTKGDLYTYDTADARLPVGTDGQMIVVDSSAATGLRWESRSVEAGFTADGAVYFTAPRAMTLDTPAATPGTASLAYAKSLAASPTSFSAVGSWPAGFAAGDTLRVTATGVSTWETVRLARTA